MQCNRARISREFEIDFEKFEGATSFRGWLGRPAKDRQALAVAFVAKSVYGLETTRRLWQRLHADRQLRCLCDWTNALEIPHESTFSRAIQEFAESELPQRLHEALIRNTQQDRLIGHIGRDSTAIEARERFPGSPKHKSILKRKPGRPRKAECALSGRRLPRQRRQSLPEMLEELTRHCSLGVKKSGSGHQQYWRRSLAYSQPLPCTIRKLPFCWPA